MNIKVTIDCNENELEQIGKLLNQLKSNQKEVVKKLKIPDEEEIEERKSFTKQLNYLKEEEKEIENTVKKRKERDNSFIQTLKQYFIDNKKAISIKELEEQFTDKEKSIITRYVWILKNANKIKSLSRGIYCYIDYDIKIEEELKYTFKDKIQIRTKIIDYCKENKVVYRDNMLKLLEIENKIGIEIIEELIKVGLYEYNSELDTLTIVNKQNHNEEPHTESEAVNQQQTKIFKTVLLNLDKQVVNNIPNVPPKLKTDTTDLLKNIKDNKTPEFIKLSERIIEIIEKSDNGKVDYFGIERYLKENEKSKAQHVLSWLTREKKVKYENFNRYYSIIY